MNDQRLLEVLSSLRGTRIVVVGDFFLDEYLLIDPAIRETSIETGLEAHQVTALRTAPGGAGTVAKDLCALGCAVKVIGVVGDDGNGFELRRGLTRSGAEVSGLIVEETLLTNAYVKPIVCGARKIPRELERYDIRQRSPLSAALQCRIRDLLREGSDWADAVVVSQYVSAGDGGILTDSATSCAAAIAQNKPEMPVLVDSRFGEFAIENSIVKCNVREASKLAGAQASEESEVEVLSSIAKYIATRTGRAAFVTIGERGIVVADMTGCRLVPGFVFEGPVDTVGAGDAALSAIGAALGAGATAVEAAFLANLSASVAVRKIGETGTPTPEEIAHVASLVASARFKSGDRAQSSQW